MNSLLLLNGSPRGACSNTMKMLSRVAEGWQRAGAQPPEILQLANADSFERAVKAYFSSDAVLLGMPLYTDAMPGLVKSYIEAIGERAKACRESAKPALGFLVQSGFPEALHSRYVERYLEKLARRLGCPYAGTIVRGGGGALSEMPEEANKKLWENLKVLGEQLACDGKFGQWQLSTVTGIERFSRFATPLLSLAIRLHLVEFMWNSQLKKNGVWQRRFAAPYGPACRS